MYGYIYKIKNKTNNKLYIGQHKYPKYELDKKYICSGIYIKKDIEKLGLNNFEISLVDFADSREELNQKEIYFIEQFNSMVPNGYNLTSGGDGAPNLTPESKIKLAYWKGKTQPPEMVQKRVNKFKKIKRTETWKRNISQSVKSSEKNQLKLKEAVKARQEKYLGSKVYTDGITEVYITKDQDPPENFVNTRKNRYNRLKEINQEEFTSFYKLHSGRQTREKYNLTGNKELNYLLEKFNINKHTKAESIELSNLSNYGYKNVMFIPEIKLKHKSNYQ